MAPPLVLSGIVRTFSDGSDEVRVLTGADFTLNTGELVALAAPSGSGKSTLLQITGLLERATSGTVTIDGVEASSLSDKDRTSIRRDKVGFIYQFHHLLGDFTARENVALPQRLAGLAPKAAL